MRYAFEFRHPSWLVDEVYDVLREREHLALRGRIGEAGSARSDHRRLRLLPAAQARLHGRAISTPSPRASKELLATGRDLYLMFKHEETPEGALNAELVLKRRPRAPIRRGPALRGDAGQWFASAEMRRSVEILEIEAEIGQRRDWLHFCAFDGAVGVQREGYVGIGVECPIAPAGDEGVVLPVFQLAGELSRVGERNGELAAALLDSRCRHTRDRDSVPA